MARSNKQQKAAVAVANIIMFKPAIYCSRKSKMVEKNEKPQTPHHKSQKM
jgi:hypothetical protein